MGRRRHDGRRTLLLAWGAVGAAALLLDGGANTLALGAAWLPVEIARRRSESPRSATPSGHAWCPSCGTLVRRGCARCALPVELFDLCRRYPGPAAHDPPR